MTLLRVQRFFCLARLASEDDDSRKATTIDRFGPCYAIDAILNSSWHVKIELLPETYAVHVVKKFSLKSKGRSWELEREGGRSVFVCKTLILSPRLFRVVCPLYVVVVGKRSFLDP